MTLKEYEYLFGEYAGKSESDFLEDSREREYEDMLTISSYRESMEREDA